MVTLTWEGRREFAATSEHGTRFAFDAQPQAGATPAGPTPMDALIASVAACSAMDVVHILEKKKQTIESYRVEVEGERSPEGIYPRPYVSLNIRHVLEGDLDPLAVEQAIRLSDEKYCSVAATLRFGPTITSDFVVRTRALAGRPK